MIKKALFAIFLILLLSQAFALQFGNELTTPLIESGSFKMMASPELDSTMFAEIRLVDENGVALENYHLELKIFDSRGVLIYPETPNPVIKRVGMNLNIWSNTGFVAFSDANGYIDFSIPLTSCNIVNDSEYCFQLDQPYTLTLTGKNLRRTETFAPKIKEIQTNWAGDTLRFVYINIDQFFIILCSAVIVIVLITLFIKKRRSK